jgi:catechol 2,3-dioxygenase-like lactoylglutathione lyase family enzyme
MTADEAYRAIPRDVPSFFHINVNCADFERSLAFYRLIGFETVLDFSRTDDKSFGVAGLGPVLGLPDDCDGRAALLMLKGDDKGLRLDLIEWISPREASPPRRTLAHPGVGRICLRTLDADAVHGRLSAAGHRCYTPPADVTLGQSMIKVFCAEDPDGVVIEFMQFMGAA